MSQPSSNNFMSSLGSSTGKQPHWCTFVSREDHDDDPFIWTIRDILTLLLIFFIVMYTNASSHVIPTAITPSTPATERKQSKDASYVQLKHEVERFMAQSTVQGFTVRWDQTRPVFVLSERITFAQGQADLLESFQPTLKRIATFIATQSGYRILVSGHSDDTPINTTAFPSNWELSSARAGGVVRFLCQNGVDPRNVSVRGYAEYAPLYANSSPENRQANRRVEITLTRESD